MRTGCKGSAPDGLPELPEAFPCVPVSTGTRQTASPGLRRPNHADWLQGVRTTRPPQAAGSLPMRTRPNGYAADGFLEPLEA